LKSYNLLDYLRRGFLLGCLLGNGIESLSSPRVFLYKTTTTLVDIDYGKGRTSSLFLPKETTFWVSIVRGGIGKEWINSNFAAGRVWRSAVARSRRSSCSCARGSSTEGGSAEWSV
jgi:hypothetical protein